MEPAKIDWKKLQWVFVEDELYEHINAPKWFDFSSPQEHLDDPAAADDVAWFCRPDCNHPTSADDFLKSTPNSNKKSANAYKTILLGERNQRDFSIKRRGLTRSPAHSNNLVHRYEDGENQNPNLLTPSNQHVMSLKEAIKSSSKKTKQIDEVPQANEAPRLKSTPSARNLFAGRNILSQITEFVGELKRLASRAKEKEENMENQKGEKNRADAKEGTGELSEETTVKGGGAAKERKPLLEVGKERSDGSSKEKHRRGVPTTITLNMENVRPKGENIVSQIRTSPPTPQCFSATRGTNKKTPPAKETRSRLMVERQILQEVRQNPEEMADKGRSSNSDGREMKTLDLFWLLKPCAPSS